MAMRPYPKPKAPKVKLPAASTAYPPYHVMKKAMDKKKAGR